MAASKLAAIEQAEARGDETTAAAAASALQRYATLLVERHTAIAGTVRARRAIALQTTLGAWQQWATLDVRDAAAAAAMQRAVDQLGALRASVVVPMPPTTDWLSDIEV